jgi:hypothetical protein
MWRIQPGSRNGVENLALQRTWVPHISRFSRDVGGDRWSPLHHLDGYQSQCSGISRELPGKPMMPLQDRAAKNAPRQRDPRPQFDPAEGYIPLPEESITTPGDP